jgi:hypothetical protein
MDHPPRKYWTGFPAGLYSGRGPPRRAAPDEGETAAEPLRIDVTGTHLPLSADQKARVMRRVLLALCRFGPQVPRVSVRLAELVSPLGKLGRRCRMRASLQGHDGIEVEVINGQIDAAVSRAARRLASRVAVALDSDISAAGRTLVREGRSGCDPSSAGGAFGLRRLVATRRHRGE